MTQDSDLIAKVIGTLEKEAKNIEETIIDICIHMRGGINWSEAWTLIPTTRNTMIDHINEHNRKMSGDTTEYF